MTNHPNRSRRPLPPFAAALKAWRARRGMTAEQAAAETHVPLARWHDMESRARSPTTHVGNAAASIILELLDELSAP